MTAARRIMSAPTSAARRLPLGGFVADLKISVKVMVLGVGEAQRAASELPQLSSELRRLVSGFRI